MNTKTNLILFLITLFVVVISTSCRSELDELTIDKGEQPLQANSKVANLILRTSMNAGSSDDIIDNSSCFNIAFPFTIAIDDQETVLTSEEDIESIKDILEESDEIIFSFPITIVFNDFSETVVATMDQFEELVSNCNDDNDSDDSDDDDDDDENIECIDFQYPFSASVFDSQSELISTVNFESDKDLYEFIDDLKEEDVVSINFPISVIFSTGIEISIIDLDNLEETIEEIIEEGCDDDDDRKNKN